jgi:hypothetical protein
MFVNNKSGFANKLPKLGISADRKFSEWGPRGVCEGKLRKINGEGEGRLRRIIWVGLDCVGNKN